MNRSLVKTTGRILMFSALMFIIVISISTSLIAQEEMTPIPMISGIEMLKVGDTAPDFSIMDLNDADYNMKEVLSTKKGVLIFFWSIFCEPCKAELPIIEELANEYIDQGISFVGVAIDGGPMKDAISAFISQEDYSFSVLIDELNPDESFKVSDPYGVAGTPTIYLIDREGIVRFSKVGRASKEELEEIIKQFL